MWIYWNTEYLSVTKESMLRLSGHRRWYSQDTVYTEIIHISLSISEYWDYILSQKILWFIYIYLCALLCVYILLLLSSFGCFITITFINSPVSLCRTRTNWPFMFTRGIIPGHSANDNDNDNKIEQCSSLPCNFGRPARKFWTCSKSLCT